MRFDRPFLASLTLLVFACAAPAPAPAPEPAPAAVALAEPVTPEGINDNFLSPALDVEDYTERFEGESREVSVHREALAATLELAPGQAVADVGAGTGLFLEALARAVGPDGRVFALDISPIFVEHLGERASAAGLAQVQPRECALDSVGLPADSIDAAWICDTYHHFEHPRATLASLHLALRPGGRLVVVDFERIPGVSREWLLGHVRADKATFRAEIEAAGFVFEDEPRIEGLEENYVLRFRRP